MKGENPDVNLQGKPHRMAWIRVASVPALFFAVVFSLLVFNVREGPDNTFYLRWSRAAVEGDIQSIYSRIQSPTGLPLIQWSAGPGLAAAPLLGLLHTPPADALSRLAELSYHLFFPPIVDAHAFHLTAAVFAVLLWLTLTKLFLIITGGSIRWSFFGLACAFSGTHLGYYSLAYGAELLPLAPMALLAVELAKPMRSRLGGVFLVGSCAAILIMIRPYLALYAAPSLVVAALRVWRHAGGQRYFLLALLAGLPVLGIGQVAMVNDWMAGDWKKSTYAYGDGNFKSLDFASPEIAAVLIHPLHGLLVYHPMYLIGFAAMVFLLFRAPTLSERSLWGSFIFVMAAHLWIQSAWYQWWLATTVTFGMRGMAIVGVPCMAALLRVIAQLRTSPVGSGWLKGLTLLVGLMSGWSWLLMIRGPTDYFTYADLLTSQLGAVGDLLAPGRVGTLVFAGVFTTISLSRFLAASNEDRTWSTMQQVAAIFLGALALDFLFQGWIDNVVDFAYYGLGFATVALAALCYRIRGRFAWKAGPLPGKAGVACLLVLVIMLGYFAHVAIPTQQQLSEGITSERSYEWKGAFYVTEVQGGYLDYLKIPGFEEKKERLKHFIEPYGLLPITDDSGEPERGSAIEGQNE